MRAIASCLAVASFACTTELPEVAPEQFACSGDEPLPSGELQCPESHWCRESVCRPRLDCTEEGSAMPGCDRSAQRRCDPVLTPLVSAVACLGGNPTITSTIARGDACLCPDQGSAGTPLFCAHVAEGTSGDYPLFLTPPGEALPVGQFGITGEVPEFRWCVRACATEVDCPASHTCRAAALMTEQLRAEPSSRHTIAVCYPNYLIGTSTTVDLPQPDDTACLSNEDCVSRICQYGVANVSDHPVLPIGSSWDGRRALVGRCIATSTGRDPGGGCTADVDCKSGICEGGKCQRPCNPVFDTACDGCLPISVERGVPGTGLEVVDTVHICETP